MTWLGFFPAGEATTAASHREVAHATGQASDRDPSLGRYVNG